MIVVLACAALTIWFVRSWTRISRRLDRDLPWLDDARRVCEDRGYHVHLVVPGSLDEQCQCWDIYSLDLDEMP